MKILKILIVMITMLSMGCMTTLNVKTIQGKPDWIHVLGVDVSGVSAIHGFYLANAFGPYAWLRFDCDDDTLHTFVKLTSARLERPTQDILAVRMEECLSLVEGMDTHLLDGWLLEGFAPRQAYSADLMHFVVGDIGKKNHHVVYAKIYECPAIKPPNVGAGSERTKNLSTHQQTNNAPSSGK